MNLRDVSLLIAVMTGANTGIAHAAPAPQVLFFNACIDGEARLSSGEATEVGFAGLPDDVREKYHAPQAVRAWRIASAGPDTYLYMFDLDAGHGNMHKICAVASKDMGQDELTRALDVRLAGGTDPTPRRSTQWMRPTDGYIVTVTTAKRYTVAQVDWLSERDKRRFQKELDLFAQ